MCEDSLLHPPTRKGHGHLHPGLCSPRLNTSRKRLCFTQQPLWRGSEQAGEFLGESGRAFGSLGEVHGNTCVLHLHFLKQVLAEGGRRLAGATVSSREEGRRHSMAGESRCLWLHGAACMLEGEEDPHSSPRKRMLHLGRKLRERADWQEPKGEMVILFGESSSREGAWGNCDQACALPRTHPQTATEGPRAGSEQELRHLPISGRLCRIFAAIGSHLRHQMS